MELAVYTRGGSVGDSGRRRAAFFRRRWPWRRERKSGGEGATQRRSRRRIPWPTEPAATAALVRRQRRQTTDPLVSRSERYAAYCPGKAAGEVRPDGYLPSWRRDRALWPLSTGCAPSHSGPKRAISSRHRDAGTERFRRPRKAGAGPALVTGRTARRRWGNQSRSGDMARPPACNATTPTRRA
jgi:hypothetical protein